MPAADCGSSVFSRFVRLDGGDLLGCGLLRRGGHIAPEAARIDDVFRRLRLCCAIVRSCLLGRFRLFGLEVLRVSRGKLERGDHARFRSPRRDGISRLAAGDIGDLDEGRSVRGVILVVVGPAFEEVVPRAQAGPDHRVIVAIAPFDIGTSQLISFQRNAVRGDMNGAPIGKYLGELIVGHRRPVTDAAGIEMDEGRSRGRVEADAAALQAQARIANLFKRYARDKEIHGVAEHVLAVARHARGTAAAEHGIGGRGAVGGDDLDRLLAVDVAIDLPKDIEQMGIHHGLVLGTPVAEVMIEQQYRAGFVYLLGSVRIAGFRFCI